MRWSDVCVEAVSYVVPDEVVRSDVLEARVAPMYKRLHLGLGQLEALTGISERRWWPKGPSLAHHAARAGREALLSAGLSPQDVDVVIYAGVGRDNLEPAAACRVAAELGVGGEALIYDISNACLGVLNGMVEVANRIQLGQARAGLVVTAESSREIVEATIARMNQHPTLEMFRLSLATLTGGSAAVGVVLTHAELSDSGHRLLGGAVRSDPQWHELCRWGPGEGLLGMSHNIMETDAAAVLTNGVALGKATWADLQRVMEWHNDDVDRVICHQVGSGHQRTILETLELRPEQDFSTFATLGNTGSAALPLTLARAAEDGFLVPGDRAALLGIGSGLNCLMLGVQW